MIDLPSSKRLRVERTMTWRWIARRLAMGHWPNVTQGSSVGMANLATRGFGAESRWDSGRADFTGSADHVTKSCAPPACWTGVRQRRN